MTVFKKITCELIEIVCNAKSITFERIIQIRLNLVRILCLIIPITIIKAVQKLLSLFWEFLKTLKKLLIILYVFY